MREHRSISIADQIFEQLERDMQEENEIVVEEDSEESEE